MPNITRWSPDTCGCVIDYILDPGMDEPMPHAIVTKCPVHQGMSDDEHMATILEENRRKNMAYPAVVASLLGVAVDDLQGTIDQEADTVLQSMAGITLEDAKKVPELEQLIQTARSVACVKLGGLTQSEYKWSFDSQREVVVELPYRVKASAGKVLLDAEASFGRGKIKVQ